MRAPLFKQFKTLHTRWLNLRPPAKASIANDLAAPGSVWASYPLRLTIFGGVILIGVIIAATWILLANLRSEQIRESERDLESLSLVLAEQLDRDLQSIEVIQNNLIDRMNSLGIKSTADLERKMSGHDTYQRLKDQITALPHIDAIVLLDPAGNLVNFSRGWPVPKIENNGANDDRARVFKDTSQTTYVDSALKNPANGDWVLPIARKISGPNGEFLGSMLGVIKLRYIEKLFESVARSNDRSISLFTKGGILVARYPRDESFRGKSFAQRAVFKKLLSQSRYGTVRQPSVTSGKELLVSGRNLPHYPMSIVITKRLEDVLAGWHYAATYVAGAALIIAFMIAGLAFIVARQIARNLQAQNRQLDAALDNMPQGLAMFDASGHLIVCNRRYIEMYDLPRETVKRGISLNDLIRIRIENGTFLKEARDPEPYTKVILADITEKAPKPLICELSDGRIVAVVNRPMPGGGWLATHEDITDAKRREASFQFLFNNNPVPMWICDLDSLRIVSVNAAAVALYGYSHEKFLTLTALDIRPVEERERFLTFFRTTGGAHAEEICWRHQKANGSTFDVGAYAQPLTYEGRRACLVALHDITERKRAEEQLRRTQKFLDTIVENVPVPILVKDVPSSITNAGDCRYTLVNKALEELFGVPREQIIGKTISELYPKERADFILAENNETLRSHQPVIISDHAVRTPRNGVRIATATSVAIRDERQNPQYLVTVLQDVTERKEWEQRTARMAHYDHMTDLPNRITFNDAMEAALEHAAKSGEQFAVLSIDLDGFKDANDTHGHLIGDALLCEIARRLQAAADGSFVARVGGDEFALIVAGAKQPGAAITVAEKVLKALKDVVDIEGRNIPIGATIGGAIYPKDGSDTKTLMINADIALYRAKAAARGSLVFFESEMGDQLRERRALFDDLQLAVERQAFFLHYQPQKKMSGSVIGLEALIRWQCPKRGLVPPSVFIPLAEQGGLIGQIDEWVLREACREAASWPTPLTIAVNISPIQFREGDLAKLVHATLLETGLAPQRLELEITEGVLVDDFSRAMSVLTRLKSLGVRIALDDFGTGYSSLSYLHAFPFDKIKIDRTFISDLERNQHSIAIVRAVIDLGHSLNIPVLAEGVETAEQHAMLFRKGCDEAQGYFIGRPLPIDAYNEFIGRDGPSESSFTVAKSDRGTKVAV
jgi:diguanylate cyclase (GGDEF)-like protein/PAS domain S-box-containing protein